MRQLKPNKVKPEDRVHVKRSVSSDARCLLSLDGVSVITSSNIFLVRKYPKYADCEPRG